MVRRRTTMRGPERVVRTRYGYTLIEVMIVLTVLGGLATMVVPLVGNVGDDASRTAFMQSLKIYTEAAKLHTLETGQPVADGSSGEIPPGFETYIQASRWEGVTPIGGVWDAEMNAFGITSAIGVHFNGTGETRAVGYMAEIDAEYDDGNLATGAFRQLDGDRYYWIIID